MEEYSPIKSLCSMRQSDDFNLAVVLLAAGESSRLGQPKQLVDYKGKSLLLWQIEKALSVAKNVYCVLGYQAQRMEKEIASYNINTVINSHWKSGMGSSIAEGVKALPKEVNGVLLLLVDQWKLSERELQLISQQWIKSPENIIVATDSSNDMSDNVKSDHKMKKLGPPVIFPKSTFALLTQLAGKAGAKSVLNQYADIVKTFYLPTAFIDLDTPEQLEKMNNS